MLLAFALAARGHNVLVIDADYGSQGVTDWGTKVYAGGGELPFDVAQWTPSMGLLVPFIQNQARETSATIVIVDVGGEAPEVLGQAIAVADRVISPVGPEQAEIGRLPATAAIIARSKVPHDVLLTRVPVPAKGSARDARRDIEAGGYAVLASEIEHNRDRYASIWGTVPGDLGAYEDLADELLKGDNT
jgi:MinD-like ATPase involved in chromosome partitioning or flagellar assembly